MRFRPIPLVLVVALLAACGDGSSATTTGAATTYSIAGYAHAGPTCPVVLDPPDPACADRPVQDAGILVLAEDGVVVARTVTQADGSFTVQVPPGSYTVVFQPVQGLLGTAPPQEVVVVDAPVAGVDGAYDTGIR
jgi:hypothetical protein